MDAGAWNDAEGLSQRALHLMQKHRWRDALEELDLALSLDPYNAANLYHRGVALDELGQFHEAMAAYEHANDIQPDHPDVLNRWALDLHQLGESRESLRLFERIHRRSPAYEPAYCNHVHLLVELGQHDLAEEVFYLARQSNEQCPRCYFTMGLSMAAQNHHEQAVRCFRRATDLPGASAEVNRRLAESLIALGDAESARVHLQQSLSISPNHAPTLSMVIDLLIDSESLAEAEKWLERLHRLTQEHASTQLLSGRLAMAQGRYEAAQRHLERATQIDPTIGRAHELLGVLYARQGKSDLARQQLHAELLLGPHSISQLYGVGRLLMELRDLGAASACFRRIVERDARMANAWLNLGVCECEQSNSDAGIEAFRAALQVSPRMAAAHHILALAMSERGNFSAAMTILRQAITLLRDDADLLNLRRRLWLRRVRRWLSYPFRKK